jgi:hypothetical protein
MLVETIGIYINNHRSELILATAIALYVRANYENLISSLLALQGATEELIREIFNSIYNNTIGDNLYRSQSEGYTDGSGYRVDPDTGERVVDPQNLPENPDDLLDYGWTEIAERAPNRRTFQDSEGNQINFDRGQPGENGWRGRDHYHVRNPNHTNSKGGYYLDINGNPVNDGNRASHIPRLISERR